MFILLKVFYIALPWFIMWGVGTFEKYPELSLPLYLIWLAVIYPQVAIPDLENYGWQKRLKSYRKTARKYGDFDLVEKLDEEIQYAEDWSEPVTVGSLKSVLGKYALHQSITYAEIEKRLSESKAGKAKS